MNPDADTSCTIHAMCAADAAYGPYAGITLSSVLQSNLGEHIHLHLLSDGVRSADIKRFQKMAEAAGAKFSSYEVAPVLDAIPGLPRRTHHYTRTAYARLFFADCLPLDVRRVIYLDCDMVCVGSLRPLWDAAANFRLVAAARDEWANADLEHKRYLGIPIEHTYFNSGMLVINVEAWRQREIARRLLCFLTGPIKTKHADQDALNGVLWREITEVPSRWNTLVSQPDRTQLDQLFATATVLHFCGAFKPWHLGYSLLVGTQSAAFRKAKAGSPWKWMLPDPQFARLKRKGTQLIGRHLRALGTT
jgi:lipopolysaccharide biosynthesis glycosyltransferase